MAMKVQTTAYGGTKQVLKFPDHYVAMTVNVSDADVAADEDGKKIVPAGTIVGGGALTTPGTPVVDVHAGARKASLEATFTDANADFTVTALEEGTAGNSIKLKLTDPSAASQSLAVSVSSKTITVSLATDDQSAITTTGGEVVEALNGNADASALIEAVLVGDGTGVVEAMTATSLSGGANSSSGATAEGVLFNDVDVTYGERPGAMILHGFIDVTKIPHAPSADDIDALPMIAFLK